MRHGIGEIEVRRGGYRVRAYVDGARKHLGTYATLPEAKAILDGLAELHARGEVSATGKTLAAYGKAWLDRRELAGVRSIGSDRGRWTRYVLAAPFASWPMRDIGRVDVRDWLDGLREVRSARGRKLSAQTILHAFKLLSGCLAEAVRDEAIVRNPCAGMRVPRPRVSPEMWSYLLPGEQLALATRPIVGGSEPARTLAEAERLIALVALGTGIRQGEQWSLELRDVHLDDASPWIFVRWGSAGKPPKNGQARRVDLFGVGLSAMRAWLAVLPSYAPRNPLGLVFPTQRGARRQKSSTPRRWESILRAAKLDKGAGRHDGRSLRWHDLRHSCASSLVAGWWGRRWTLHEVQHLLGHRSLAVTERYAHLAESVLAEAGAGTAGLVTVPGTVPSEDLATALSARNLGARHTRFERVAFGSGGPMGREHHRTDAGPWDRLGTVARAYLRALETRSRHVHRHGVALAEAVLELCAADGDAEDRRSVG